MSRQYCVYILTNIRNTVLYVGVTSNLVRRVWEHKQKLIEGFTQKYNVTKLVYYEIHSDVENAIGCEKELKNLVRRKKNQLINQLNPGWSDLYSEILSSR